MNVDLLEIDSRKTIEYTNFLHSFHFMPMIDKITRYYTNRVSSLSGSILDHIYINKPVSHSTGVIIHSITDHCPTFGHFLFNLRRNGSNSAKEK